MGLVVANRERPAAAAQLDYAEHEAAWRRASQSRCAGFSRSAPEDRRNEAAGMMHTGYYFWIFSGCAGEYSWAADSDGGCLFVASEECGAAAVILIAKA